MRVAPAPAPQGRRRAPVLTRCSAPSVGRGRSSRPSWGQSCWAWRAPPAAVSAAPRALGPWHGAPRSPAPGGAGGGTRKGALGAGSGSTGPANSAELLRRAWRGGGAAGGGALPRSPASGPAGGKSEHGRPSRRPIGGADGPGAGAVAPAANKGEAGLPPGPIPGGPRGRGPMARRGDTTCRAGRGPPAANGSARGPALPGNPRRLRRSGTPTAAALRVPLGAVGFGARDS